MSLKRDTLYTFLTQAPTLVLYFVASTLMTRILGDEGRGAFALLQNQVSFMVLVMGFGLGFGSTYFTAKDHGDPTRIVRICASLLLINMVLVPATFLLVFGHAHLRNVFIPAKATHWAYLAYLVLTVILTQLTSFISSILLGLKKFRALNQMSIAGAALNAVAFLVLYLVRGHIAPERVLPWVLGILLGITLIIALLWVAIYVRMVGIPPVPTWDMTLIRPVFTFVMISYLGNFINLINYRFDVWVVGSYAGTAQLGLYTVAVSLGQMFFYIPDPFAKVIQPYLFGEMSPALLAKFKFIMRLSCTTVAILAACLGLAAPWLVPGLFGSVFRDSISALWWLLPGIIFVCASKLLGLLVIQGNMIRFNLYGAAAAAVVTIGLDFLLVPRWGITGAAVASSLAYLTNLVVQGAVVRNRLKISLHDMFILHLSDFARLRQLAQERLAITRGN